MPSESWIRIFRQPYALGRMPDISAVLQALVSANRLFISETNQGQAAFSVYLRGLKNLTVL
jgi:hypothetical protein